MDDQTGPSARVSDFAQIKGNTREIEMNIGLALGSGSARGWSHIGVISALSDQGIVPDIVCGTSVGSLVGASYVSDALEKLEEWVCSLTKFETARFFEITPSLNGFVNTERLRHFLNEYVARDDALKSYRRLRQYYPGQDHQEPHGWGPTGYFAFSESIPYRLIGVLSGK